MSRVPPLMPSAPGHAYSSSPKMGAAAVYTNSPSGSPRPFFAQQLSSGALSPYRDSPSRFAHLGSPRISSLSRDATAALKGSYPTSSSRPTSPSPHSQSSSSSSSDASDSVSHSPHADQDEPPVPNTSTSMLRQTSATRHGEQDNSASPGAARRHLQPYPIDTKSKYIASRKGFVSFSASSYSAWKRFMFIA